MTTTRRLLMGLLCGIPLLGALTAFEAAAQEQRTLRRMPRRPTLQPTVARKPPAPMLAVVGLREQRITIYDQTGAQMLQSPVSSGQPGYETPPGVFSVVQKEPDHRSNLYDDASMPHMQRLTWTGIALHAGALPGYAASHGCVRLPEDFADQLYDLTKIGMRVVIQREGLAPAPIATPAMFKRPDATARAEPSDNAHPAIPLDARLPALEIAQDDAAEREKESRAAASRSRAAALTAERAEKAAEAALARQEAELQAAMKMLEGTPSLKRIADAEARVGAAEKAIEKAREALAKAQADGTAKAEAAQKAEEAATAAGEARMKAVAAFEQAKLAAAPVSVFVSRKTQRIYVRKAFQPVWEGPIFIRDADKPIGTFVFTGNEPDYEGTNPGRELAWSVLSMYRDPTAPEPPSPKQKGKAASASIELAATNVAAAEAALARLEITPEMTKLISDNVLPGSSLIISDEPPHLETGKDTDFVVIMTGEPQGGIAIRQRSKPERSYVADDEDWAARRARRGGGGGGGLFGTWPD